MPLKDLMNVFNMQQPAAGPQSPEDLYDPSEFVQDADVNPLWNEDGTPVNSQWGLDLEYLDDGDMGSMAPGGSPQGSTEEYEALASQLQQVRDGDKRYQDRVLERNKERDATASKVRGGGY